MFSDTAFARSDRNHVAHLRTGKLAFGHRQSRLFCDVFVFMIQSFQGRIPPTTLKAAAPKKRR